MSHAPDSNDPPPKPSGADETADSADDSVSKGVSRKLRYDSPVLDIPRPFHLRPNDSESDEGAA
jgi:hypothetical protein